MFRIGSLLFIPAYLTVILYRYLATDGPGNNFLVMTGAQNFGLGGKHTEP